MRISHIMVSSCTPPCSGYQLPRPTANAIEPKQVTMSSTRHQIRITRHVHPGAVLNTYQSNYLITCRTYSPTNLPTFYLPIV